MWALQFWAVCGCSNIFQSIGTINLIGNDTLQLKCVF